MKIPELAAAIRRYQRTVGMTDPLRYSSTVQSVAEAPGIFGMNFSLGQLPAEERIAGFMAQEQQAELLRAVITGQDFDPAALKSQFGLDAEELARYQAEANPIKKPIPDKLVVLSFDDGFRDQYEVAAPLLKQYGFNATFFIAEMEPVASGPHANPGFQDKTMYMTWAQIKELEEMGFELGNHSLHHVAGAHTKGRDFNRGEMLGMEQEFGLNGLKKPVSYAYPSGICNQDTFSCAEELGYRWARGNMENGICGMSAMTYYEPLMDSPLAMRSYGDPDFYTEECLEARIAGTCDGRILGLTYHEVSKTGSLPHATSFQRQMEILKATGCTVISMADLEEYIDPKKALAYTAEQF